MSQSVRRLSTEQNLLRVEFERPVRLDAKVDGYSALVALDDRAVYDYSHVVHERVGVLDDRAKAIVPRRGRRSRLAQL